MSVNEITDHWPVNDLPYGWAGECWIRNDNNFRNHFQLFEDAMHWALYNISNCQSNMQWKLQGHAMYFRFRKEDDMMWFKLKWNAQS